MPTTLAPAAGAAWPGRLGAAPCESGAGWTRGRPRRGVPGSTAASRGLSKRAGSLGAGSAAFAVPRRRGASPTGFGARAAGCGARRSGARASSRVCGDAGHGGAATRGAEAPADLGAAAETAAGAGAALRRLVGLGQLDEERSPRFAVDLDGHSPRAGRPGPRDGWQDARPR